jgi:micrococcal nuclease
MRYLVSLLLFLLHPLGAFAGFTGPVVSVLDGDTIEVLHNTHPERIRLSGIDCLEKWINVIVSQFPRLAV